MTTSRSRPGWSASRALAVGALLAAALFAARLWTGRLFDDGPWPMALAEARNLPVTRADGARARLGDAIRPGLPTVVSLWASWCGPCREEAPALAALRRRFGPDALNLIYLNVRDPGAHPDTLAALTRAAGLPSDSYLRMEDAHVPRFGRDLALTIPRTYVFDRTGQPSAMIVGFKPLALARVAGLVSA